MNIRNAMVGLFMLPLTAFAGDLFPPQPVPMSEGYGANGAGNHFAVPFGQPGEDCAINPVSFKTMSREVTTVEEIVEKKMVAGDIISIPSHVLFDFDKDEIRPDGEKELEHVYELLEKAGVTRLKVTGHTDSKGTDEYNEDLGLRRARAVAIALFDMGLSDIDVASGGERFPVAPNTNEDGSDNPEGRQENRRVELEVIAVRDVEIEEVVKISETQTVVTDRNPQIFHVLSTGNRVGCGLDPQNRDALMWNYNRGGLINEGVFLRNWR